MAYCTGRHTKFYHRYRIVWVTKYRFKVMQGDIRWRLREIIRQTCSDMGVHIVKGVLARDRVRIFVSVPPKLSLSDAMQRIKRRSSRKIQMEFLDLKKRYWGRHFWGRGYFSTTNGAITEDVVLQYLQQHIANPTDASR